MPLETLAEDDVLPGVEGIRESPEKILGEWMQELYDCIENRYREAFQFAVKIPCWDDMQKMYMARLDVLQNGQKITQYALCIDAKGNQTMTMFPHSIIRCIDIPRSECTSARIHCHLVLLLLESVGEDAEGVLEEFSDLHYQDRDGYNPARVVQM